ncbi:MAG: phosphatase PAP2 family protein [Bacillota bacterium]|nr:phosphatase PAP2 family protein [Bacillota bacterium]
MSGSAAVSWAGADVLGGLQTLRAVQAIHGPLLDRFFIAVTMLGSEEFYLLIIPFLYWCVDRAFGRRLGQLFLFSAFVNVWLKGAFHTLRPPAGEVRVLFGESGTGYAFPSGHAQSAATFWGYLALLRRRWWSAALAGTLILLVAVSRLYLGVHWPIDVVGGMALGLLLAWVWARLGRRWDEELEAIIGPLRATASFLLPLLLLLVERSPDAVKAVGILSGFSGGAVLAEEWAPSFRVERWGHQLAKVLLGLPGLFLLRTGLKALFPETLLFDGVRYGLVGLWVGFIVPWLFAWVWPAASGGR